MVVIGTLCEDEETAHDMEIDGEFTAPEEWTVSDLQEEGKVI